MLEQEVTARSEDAPKPRRARAEARESGTAEIADWRSFRVFNLKLRPILRLTDHLTAESRSVAHAFVTVASNLKSREPLWFGGERKKETLDEFFRTQLSRKQRHGIEAACVDMWEPYRLSLAQWAPGCRLVYDKLHILQHANAALHEVRRAEFFRQGGRMRGLVKGNRWLLLIRWKIGLAENPRSARPVYISEELVQKLREYKKQFPNAVDEDFVFPSETGKTPVSYKTSESLASSD